MPVCKRDGNATMSFFAGHVCLIRNASSGWLVVLCGAWFCFCMWWFGFHQKMSLLAMAAAMVDRVIGTGPAEDSPQSVGDVDVVVGSCKLFVCL